MLWTRVPKKQRKRLLIHALKIAVGSSAAIYIAKALNLQFETSAGSIALLTIVTTKWETLRLSLSRVITFLVTAVLAWIIFANLSSEWAAYGIYIFLLVVLSEALGWKPTISVNAVIGTHFLSVRDFGIEFILNEFLLVLIGISIAIILNLFTDNHSRKKSLIQNMRYTEGQLQMILRELGEYLLKMEMSRNVWDDLSGLEKKLHEFLQDAYEYQNNTFQSHPGYYIDYFEMRMQQCGILHNLHYEMKKIRNMPKQARIISDYMLYLLNYVIEKNSPQEQIEKLEQIFEDMKKEPMPVTREEFESRALLYHILMDLEEFLMFKKRFVNALDEKKLRLYWNMDAGK
ncbi:MAG: aromatic acid exporter family protein [Eubacteriales bacterium]|nr:aromatic acid exporter family protein [Eubacteriales bacterium]